MRLSWIKVANAVLESVTGSSDFFYASEKNIEIRSAADIWKTGIKAEYFKCCSHKCPFIQITNCK